MPQLTAERRVLYSIALFIILLTAVALPFSKIRPSLHSLAFPTVVLGCFLFLAAYARFRRLEKLRIIVECYGFSIFLSIPLMAGSYIAASFNLPLTDHLLMAWDDTLGFDWIGFIRWVDSSPLIAKTLQRAYESFSIQLLLLPLILILTGRSARAYMMIAGYMAICTVAIVIFVWFPALGTYPIYDPHQTGFDNINPGYIYGFLIDFTAVRSMEVFEFSFATSSGIITMPSVHAAVAMLCAWAAWDWRFARYPMAIWNLLMTVSAISHANHYLVDALAGWAIAIFAIVMIKAACKWQTFPSICRLLSRPEPTGAGERTHGLIGGVRPLAQASIARTTPYRA